MRRKIIFTASVFSLVVVLAVTGFMAWRFVRGRALLRGAYAQIVSKRDIVDTTRNSLEALAAAEAHAEHYFLTGDSTSAKALEDDRHTWEDESGTLSLVAVNDRASAEVRDFLKSGREAMTELNTAVEAYRKSGRDKATEFVRAGSGIRALEKARDSGSRIVTKDGSGPDGLPYMLRISGLTFHRLAQGIGVLGSLGMLACILLAFETRRAASKS